MQHISLKTINKDKRWRISIFKQRKDEVINLKRMWRNGLKVVLERWWFF